MHAALSPSLSLSLPFPPTPPCLHPSHFPYSSPPPPSPAAQGIYLLENGLEAFIYVGKAVPPATLQALLGACTACRRAGAAEGAGLAQAQRLQAMGLLSPSPCTLPPHPPTPANPTPAGIPALEAADPQRPLALPELSTPLNAAARALLDELRRQRTAYLRLRVLRRGDPLEPVFYSALVEDRAPAGGMSYVEHLCFVHRAIQNRIS